MHFSRITTVAAVALCSVSSVLATLPISPAQRAVLQRREHYAEVNYTLPNGTVIEVNSEDVSASFTGTSTSGASPSFIQLIPLTLGIWTAGTFLITFT